MLTVYSNITVKYGFIHESGKNPFLNRSNSTGLLASINSADDVFVIPRTLEEVISAETLSILQEKEIVPEEPELLRKRREVVITPETKGKNTIAIAQIPGKYE